MCCVYAKSQHPTNKHQNTKKAAILIIYLSFLIIKQEHVGTKVDASWLGIVFQVFFTSYRNVVQEEGVGGIDWINLTT